MKVTEDSKKLLIEVGASGDGSGVTVFADAARADTPYAPTAAVASAKSDDQEVRFGTATNMRCCSIWLLPFLSRRLLFTPNSPLINPWFRAQYSILYENHNTSQDSRDRGSKCCVAVSAFTNAPRYYCCCSCHNRW